MSAERKGTSLEKKSYIMTSKSIVILTLKRHEEGIWIRRLVQALKNAISITEGESGNDSTSFRKTLVVVQVCALEVWMAKGLLVSDCKSSVFQGVAGVVNRVSDAAPPSLFKACLAILGAAQSSGIPVVNGPISYTLCANKWCQHILFGRANLQSPPTKAYYHSSDFSTARTGAETLENNCVGGEYLIKPNSGGFGAGIEKTSTLPEQLPIFEDDVTLVQHYIPPKDRKLYRVWFLKGKVQCAVERTLQDDDGETEFTGACASDTCSIRLPSLEAYKLPEEVRLEMEGQLLPLLKDAHCGSIEYLISESGERLYFDLNLLSTLPVNVADPHNIWGTNYNPWQELGDTIWQILNDTRIRQVD